MHLVRLAAKFLGWLTGALAGIAAVFYAFGYLVTQTYFHLLGIQILLPSNRDFYLQEGANFFIVTGLKVAILALGLVLVALVVCIPYGIVKKSAASGRLAAPLGKLRGRLPGEHDRQWQAAGLLILVILLAYPLISNLDHFRAPLTIASLLANAQEADYADSLGTAARKVFEALMNEDKRPELDERYHLLLIHSLFAGFLAWAAVRITRSWPLNSVLSFPFVVVFLIYLFLLPLDYAILQKRAVFPSVTVLTTVDQASNLSGELQLLNKTDRELILWNASSRRMIWLPVSKIVKLEIGAAKPAFVTPAADEKERSNP